MNIRHIAGEFDGVKQFCIVCGLAIVDYENVSFYPPLQPGESLASWPAGELYFCGKNPTMITSTISPDEEFEDCKP